MTHPLAMKVLNTTMKHLFDFYGKPSVAKSVFVPEIERMQKALNAIAPLLMNSAVDLHQIAKDTNLSLTELRYDGWEALFKYIRELEEKVKRTEAELEARNKKMRDLVIFVEETSQKVVKLYREGTLRNAND